MHIDEFVQLMQPLLHYLHVEVEGSKYCPTRQLNEHFVLSGDKIYPY